MSQQPEAKGQPAPTAAPRQQRLKVSAQYAQMRQHEDAKSRAISQQQIQLASERWRRENPQFTNWEKNIDSMYANFKRYIDVDTVLTVSEFNRFAPLFDVELRNRLASGDTNTDEGKQVWDLSDEFYRRVNVRRPIHIVDDITGKEVCPPLPPVMANLNSIHGDDTELMDSLASAMQLDDGSVAGPAAIRRVKALHDLARTYISKYQNLADIKQQRAVFDTMAAKVDHSGVVAGKEVIPEQTTAAQPTPTTAANEPAGDPTADMDFELD